MKTRGRKWCGQYELQIRYPNGGPYRIIYRKRLKR